VRRFLHLNPARNDAVSRPGAGVHEQRIMAMRALKEFAIGDMAVLLAVAFERAVEMALFHRVGWVFSPILVLCSLLGVLAYRFCEPRAIIGAVLIGEAFGTSLIFGHILTGRAP
jgi:hypothetical protein